MAQLISGSIDGEFAEYENPSPELRNLGAKKIYTGHTIPYDQMLIG